MELTAIVILLFTNSVFIYKYFKKKPVIQYEESAILADLLVHNKSILRVERINPGNLFIRSPRDL